MAVNIKAKNVKYGHIGNVVILIFPDEPEAIRWMTHIQNRQINKLMQGLKLDDNVLKPSMKQLTPKFDPRSIV